MKLKKEAPYNAGTKQRAKELATILCKDNSISLKNKVLSAFSSGARYTARQLNAMFSFNDSRKVISTLRQQGYNIVDRRLLDGRKEYRLIPDSQLSLFAEGGAEL
jgi:hypothetical protein